MLSVFRFIWRLLSGLADVLRKLLTVLFALFFVFTLVMLWRGETPVRVDNNIALVVAPIGAIVEHDDTDPRQRIYEDFMDEPPAVTPLGEIIDAIDAATTDTRIGMLFLKLDEGFSAGQAQLDEMGEVIAEFRASGKPVFAWAPSMGQAEYFLAAHADKVYIDPMGAVFVPGFELEQLYFADALESLGVDVHVFRQGRYKSAVEPFIRNDMSDEARANADRWLGSLWGQWKARVADLRGLTPESLQSYADDLVAHLAATEGDMAQVAVDHGLVTAALPLSAVRTAAADIVGRDAEHGSFRQIWQGQYLRAIDRAESAAPAVVSEAKAVDKRYLALVHVQGEIVDGDGQPGQAGGSLTRSLIEDATRDKNVAGLLLRVDSPGGSVSASEEIRRALQEFQETGRPVVVSMGSVAASGGYWVSMNADKIVAAPSTITGSIGVFGLVPTVDRAFDKLGVSTDGTGTTVWAGALSLGRPLSGQARAALELIVKHDYRMFIEEVAAARGMTPEAVEGVASGQVWSGEQARDMGLVDQLGSFEVAVGILQEAAGVGPQTRLELFAPTADLGSFLLQMLSSRISSSLAAEFSLPAAWLRAGDALQPLAGVIENNVRGTVAHCLCDSRKSLYSR